MWVDIEAPEGVTEKDYQFLPSKADHFTVGKSRVHLVPASPVSIRSHSTH